jgi:hypothetical protein
MQRSLLVVGIAMTAFVFFLPFGYGLDIGPGPNFVRALLWEYMDAPWFSGLRAVSAGIFLDSLLCTFPRFIFLYQVLRYYLGKTARKSLISIAIAVELFPPLVSAVRVAGWLLGWTQPPPPLSDLQSPVYVPIPLLLIMGLGATLILPPGYREIGGAREPDRRNRAAR